MVSDHNYTISKNSRPHSIYGTVCSVLVFRELTAVASSHAGHRRLSPALGSDGWCRRWVCIMKRAWVLWVSVGGQEDTRAQNYECAVAHSHYPQLLYQLWICWYESQQCLPSLQRRMDSYSCEDTQGRRLPIIKPGMKRENDRVEEERRKWQRHQIEMRGGGR